MIKEAYCSFEVAKLLKEKGFNEPCRYFYKFDSDEIYNGTVFTNSQIGDKFYNAPTHQMAMAWLREDKNILITVYTVNKRLRKEYGTYEAVLYDIDEDVEILISKYGISGEHIFAKTYEEAVEAALKYVLENLI